jgi:6-phosphogluconate dehydrogenase
MEIGMVGLGRMGANMAARLVQRGHRVVGYDPRAQAVQGLRQQGGVGVDSLAALTEHLAPPRAVWLMVPSGKSVDETIEGLLPLLSAGDAVIDGGNSYYRDSMRRAARMAERSLEFLDVGTSGGIWGLTEGFSLMVGGDQESVRRITPIFQALAPSPDRGWGHVGSTGSGHFVKMIHNGIEYGLMQAYAEGFDLMRAKQDLHLNLRQVAEIWRYGSVVRSWLLELIAQALQNNPDLDGVAAYVPDSGEGRWTLMESLELERPIPVIALALDRWFRSRLENPFGDRLLAALRQQFGGHPVKHL